MKEVLGTECTLWRNNSAPFPYEVAAKLKMKPGDKFQYIDYGTHIEVEKVSV